jgi:xanthine dehydrogenase accessory factor
MSKSNFVLIRGGGDLASGVALRLHRAGIHVLIAELPNPLAVRRAVSFSDAVHERTHSVEGVKAMLIERNQFAARDEADAIPVIVDPGASILSLHEFPVVVDARLLKRPPEPLPVRVPLHIGLGPGFYAGRDCDAVIETQRSHTLGRVFWNGSTQPDSGDPEGDPRRVLRAPHTGVITVHAKIGDRVQPGQPLVEVRDPQSDRRSTVASPFAGVLRGILRDGTDVTKGLKIGDVDSRNDVSACFLVSDKSLAIGGGALEAILSRREIRERIFPTTPQAEGM